MQMVVPVLGIKYEWAEHHSWAWILYISRQRSMDVQDYGMLWQVVFIVFSFYKLWWCKNCSWTGKKAPQLLICISPSWREIYEIGEDVLSLSSPDHIHLHSGWGLKCRRDAKWSERRKKKNKQNNNNSSNNNSNNQEKKKPKNNKKTHRGRNQVLYVKN